MSEEKQINELTRFYKKMAKTPKLCDYNDNGDLIELDKAGNVLKTIPLPTYRRPTYEELNEMEQKRIEDISMLHKEFEDAKRELRSLLSNVDATDYEILAVNKKISEKDILLQSTRFPLRYVYNDKGISICDMDFTQLNEKRKYPYSFHFLQQFPFTLQNQYARTSKLPDKPLISLAEIKEMNTEPVILFSNTNDYSYLSLEWAIELEYNGTMYHSAHQALYAEIAKALNDQENLEKIMVSDFNYSLEKIPNREQNEELWYKTINDNIRPINYEKFNKYPELALKLLETKTAKLGACIVNDNLMGIGISFDNIKANNPIHWTGQNQLGKALMSIRDQIRTERSIVKPIIKPVRKRPVVQAPVTTVAPVAEPVQEPVAEPVTTIAPVQEPITQVPVKAPRVIRKRPVVNAQAPVLPAPVLPEPVVNVVQAPLVNAAAPVVPVVNVAPAPVVPRVIRKRPVVNMQPVPMQPMQPVQIQPMQPVPIQPIQLQPMNQPMKPIPTNQQMQIQL